MRRIFLRLSVTLAMLSTSTPVHAQYDWTQQSPASSPPARSDGGMVWNSTSGTIYLFGGLDPNSNLLNDTWSYSGATWTNLSPATSPTARSNFGLAFDKSNNETVLFGGALSINVNSQTWTFNGMYSDN